MNVCLVVGDFPPEGIGGEALSAQKMVEMLPKYGVDLEVIAPGKKNPKDRDYGVPIHRVGMHGPNFITRTPTFTINAKKIAEKTGADLIHATNRLAGLKKTKPLILHFRTTHYEAYRFFRKNGKHFYSTAHRLFIPFDRGMAEKADRVFVLTEKMMENASDWINREKITVVPNGVDLNIFKPGEKNFGGKQILYVGRFDEFKNVETLILAHRILGDRYTLNLAGYGPLEGKLRKMGEGQKINFLGRISHEKLPEIYSHNNVCVMPSSYEPFGKVALEAMACGTPTIVSRDSPDFGCPRFKTHDPHELAEKILAATSDTQAEKKSSKKMRLLSLEYGWEKTCRKTISEYKKILG